MGLSRKDHQDKAEEYIDKEKPLVLIGSPPCTPFTQLQSLNPVNDNCRRRWDEGVEHIRSVVKLYQK